MGKIKNIGQDLSLRKSIVMYITVFAFVALILSVLTASFCEVVSRNIQDNYPPTGEKYYLTTEDGQRLGEGAYIGSFQATMSQNDQKKVSLLGAIPIVATPIYTAICIIIASLLFYKNKLKKPLIELQLASEKISNNNLDFTIKYNSKDELGSLCTSFERMRSTLASNFQQMWRQVEERKQINSAFAHDLRTPLTVLKGYNEILKTSSDFKTKDTATTMTKHILRLEQYVDNMSSLQRLEDTKPKYKEVYLQEFLPLLTENAKILCKQNEKNLYVENNITAQKMIFDPEFILQVSNNLIANAVRYASLSITIIFKENNGGLLLCVIDDGKGFSKDSLINGTNPYFTKENSTENFGLGLYICKILCEHHGGYLKLENLENGAKVSAFFKSSTL